MGTLTTMETTKWFTPESCENLCFFHSKSVRFPVQGLENVSIEHHPTIGDLKSNRYLKVMWNQSPKRDVYQPLFNAGSWNWRNPKLQASYKFGRILDGLWIPAFYVTLRDKHMEAKDVETRIMQPDRTSEIRTTPQSGSICITTTIPSRPGKSKSCDIP